MRVYFIVFLCTENENRTKCQNSKAEIITQFSLKTIALFSRLDYSATYLICLVKQHKETTSVIQPCV